MKKQITFNEVKDLEYRHVYLYLYIIDNINKSENKQFRIKINDNETGLSHFQIREGLNHLLEKNKINIKTGKHNHKFITLQ